MTKLFPLSLAATLALAGTAAHAETDPATRGYIDGAFRAMDANRDGRIDHAEFDRFMHARLAKQMAKFDADFARLDTKHDGRISRQEAAANPLLAKYFDVVDTNHDGYVSKEELRSAMLSAQAENQGLN